MFRPRSSVHSSTMMPKSSWSCFWSRDDDDDDDDDSDGEAFDIFVDGADYYFALPRFGAPKTRDDAVSSSSSFSRANERQTTSSSSSSRRFCAFWSVILTRVYQTLLLRRWKALYCGVLCLLCRKKKKKKKTKKYSSSLDFFLLDDDTIIMEKKSITRAYY